MDFAIKIEARF